MSVSERFVQIGLLGEAVDGAGVAVLVAEQERRLRGREHLRVELLGYAREELVTLRVHDVMVDDDVQAPARAS